MQFKLIIFHRGGHFVMCDACKGTTSRSNLGRNYRLWVQDNSSEILFICE